MRKVKASSLLETIVAMVILLTVFSISIVIIQNVIRTASVGARTNAYFVLEEELFETIKAKKYFNEEIDHEQFKVSREVFDSVLSDSLLVIELKASDAEGLVLTSLKETVLKDE